MNDPEFVELSETPDSPSGKTTKNQRETVGGTSREGRTQREGILKSITGAASLAERGLKIDVTKETEELSETDGLTAHAGYLLARLDFKSSEMPMEQWNINVFYEEWKEWESYTKELKARLANETVPFEERKQLGEINRVVGGVKSAITQAVIRAHGEEGATDLFSSAKEVSRRLDEKDGMVNGNNIQDEAISRSFAKFLATSSEDGFSDYSKIKAEMDKWNQIAEGKDLSNDPAAIQVIDKVQNWLTSKMRERLATLKERRGQDEHEEPMASTSEGEDEEGNEDEDVSRAVERRRNRGLRQQAADYLKQYTLNAKDAPPIPEGEFRDEVERQSVVKWLVRDRSKIDSNVLRVMTAAHGAPEQGASARAGAVERLGNVAEDFAAKEQAWLLHKKKWQSLKEARADLATIEKGTGADNKEEIKELKDWEIYGWTKKHQTNVADRLQSEFGLTYESQQKLMQIELLLAGHTGDEALEYLTKIAEGTGHQVHHSKKMLVDELNDYREEIMKLVYSKDEIEYRVESKIENEARDMYEVAGQIGGRFTALFGEDGMHPVWERKVAREARGIKKEGVKVLNDDGYVIDARGNVVKDANDKPLRRALLNKENQLVDGYGTVLKGADGNPVKLAEGFKIKLRRHKLINKANMLLWTRERSVWLDDYNEKSEVDFFNQIQVDKRFAPLTVKKMLDNKDQVFVGNQEEINEITGEKERYMDLFHQVLDESYALTQTRNTHLAYEKAPKFDDKELGNKIFQLFYDSHFTKPTLGATIWYFLAQMPDQMTTLATTDGKLGALNVTHYLTYYHLTNFTKLEQMFGKKDAAGNVDLSHSELFTAFGLRKSLDNIINKKRASLYGASRDPSDYWDLYYEMEEFVDQEGRSKTRVKKKYWGDGKEERCYRNSEVDAAFDEYGKIRNKHAFVNLINVFSKPNPNARMEKTVNEAIRLSVARLHGLMTEKKDDDGNFIDEDGNRIPEGGKPVMWMKPESREDINSQYSAIVAHKLVRFTGAAARNDVGKIGQGDSDNDKDTFPIGYDAMTRFLHFGRIRKKYYWQDMKTGKTRGGVAGNPYTIDQYKGLVQDYMMGIPSLVKMKLKDKDGNVRKKVVEREVKENGKVVKKIRYLVDMEVEKPLLFIFQDLHDARREIDRFEIPRKEEERRTGREIPKSQAEKDAQRKYHLLASELEFENNAEQHWHANQLNRAIKIYGDIMSGAPLSLKGEPTFEVGYTLNRDVIHKEINEKITAWRYLTYTYGKISFNTPVWGLDHSDNTWKEMSTAQSMFGKDMLNIKEFKTDGVIDPDKIQENAWLLYQQALLVYFAGELLAYRQSRTWSTDPRHDFAWYDDILHIIEKIPSQYQGNENEMKYVQLGPFFREERMNWLRKKSGTTHANLYGLAFLKDIFIGRSPKAGEGVIWGGMGELLQLMMRGMFRGL